MVQNPSDHGEVVSSHSAAARSLLLVPIRFTPCRLVLALPSRSKAPLQRQIQLCHPR